MNGQNSSLGELMNPMQPQGRVPSMPQQTMVSPQAPKQPNAPQPMQPAPVPAAPAMPPAPAMMPQQGPSIVDLMMQRILAAGGQGSMSLPGIAPDTTQVAPGLQTAPVRGTTPTVGGR